MSQLSFKGLLLDLNGVFFSEDKALSGATSIVDFLKKKQIPVRYLTNTTTLTRKDLSKNLVAMGLDINDQHIISPAQAAVLYLKKMKNPSIHLVVNDNIKSEFEEFNFTHTNPDVIVIGDIDDRWNYKIMNKLFEMISFGAQIIALHKNKYWQEKGKLRIDIGVFIAGLEYASGKNSMIVGKPSKSFYDLALEDTGLNCKDICMVGDDIFADIEGAHNAGLKSCLVKTGKYREDLVSNSNISPDLLIDSIGDLMPWLKKI